VRSIGAGIEAFFSDTDTESIPAVSADTEYLMPVSVSPYCTVNSQKHWCFRNMLAYSTRTDAIS